MFFCLMGMLFAIQTDINSKGGEPDRFCGGMAAMFFVGAVGIGLFNFIVFLGLAAS